MFDKMNCLCVQVASFRMIHSSPLDSVIRLQFQFRPYLFKSSLDIELWPKISQELCIISHIFKDF
jgi:hypothetical protein